MTAFFPWMRPRHSALRISMLTGSLLLGLSACGGGGGGDGAVSPSTVSVTLPVADTEAEFRNLDLTLNLPTGRSQQTLDWQDGEREFILYVPASLDQSTRAPLLFSFHGMGGSDGAQYSRSDFDLVADTEDFILITPQAVSVSGTIRWNLTGQTAAPYADDAGLVLTLINLLVDAGRVDPDRVYAAGYSDGGYFSLELACLAGDYFAAVASVAGAMTSQQRSHCQPSRAMPVLQIHGQSDDVVPYTSAQAAVSFWTNIDQTGNTPSTTALPDSNPGDGVSVNLLSYGPGINNTRVDHYQVVGGEHAWPGRNGQGDLDSSVTIWAFLSQYDRDGLRL